MNGVRVCLFKKNGEYKFFGDTVQRIFESPGCTQPGSHCYHDLWGDVSIPPALYCFLSQVPVYEIKHSFLIIR